MQKTAALNYPFIGAKAFKINFKLFSNIFSRFALFSLIFFLFSLLIVSVWQINAYSKDVFMLQTLNQKLSATSKENKNLEINFNKSNSLANFENFLSSENFEKAAKIDYIRIPDSKVVLEER